MRPTFSQTTAVTPCPTSAPSTIFDPPWKNAGLEHLVSPDDLRRCENWEHLGTLLTKRLQDDPLRQLVHRRSLSVRGWIQKILQISRTHPHVPPVLQMEDGRLALLREQAGKGASGECWTADLEEEPAMVLAKLSKTTPRDTLQFTRERRTLSLIDHARVPQLHGVGTAKEKNCLCMQYVHGATLEEVLPEKSLLLSPASLLPLLKDITDILVAIHANGWIHGDVKPSNILIGTTEQQRCIGAWLIDFGLSRRANDLPTLEGSTSGTPSYIDPVMVERSDAIDASSDMFALGATFYRLYTGRLLFDRAEWMEPLLHGRHDIDWFNRCIEAKRAHFKALPSRHLALEHLILSVLKSCGTGTNRRPSAAEISERLGKLIGNFPAFQEHMHLPPRRAHAVEMLRARLLAILSADARSQVPAQFPGTPPVAPHCLADYRTEDRA